MADKCFCHLGGYQVKDSVARENLNNIENTLSTVQDNLRSVNAGVGSISGVLTTARETINTVSGKVNNLEYTVSALESGVSNLESDVSNLESKVDELPKTFELSDEDKAEIAGMIGVTDSVPTYVKDEAERVADKVLGVRGCKSFVFGAVSDLHTKGTEAGILHAGQGMDAINAITQLDLVANFGDVVEKDLDEAGKEGLKYARKCFYDISKAVPYIQMQGNHDTLSTDTTEEAQQKYYAYIGANNVGTVTDHTNKFRNYGYRDFENYKIRVIYLNTADVSDEALTGDYNVSPEQLNWLNTVALNLTDTDWGIIVLTHHPLNWYGMTNLLNALDAYKGEGTGAKLIAHFHGHLHNFRAETLGTNKIPSITIPNACNGRENDYATNPSYDSKQPEYAQKYGDPVAYDDTAVEIQRKFQKTANSANDTAFNVVVIDTENEVIHAFCYGAGIDRAISYGGTLDETEKEEIPSGGDDNTGTDTPADGYTNVIDTVGYTNNARLSTSGEDTDLGEDIKEAEGYVTTGHIPVAYGSVVRTQGVDFRKSQNTNCAFAIYDNGTFKTAGGLTLLDSSGIKTEFDSEGNLTLTCLGSFNYDNPTLRLTGFGTGASLIVTVNEEII